MHRYSLGSIVHLPHWRWPSEKQKELFPGLTGLYLNATVRTFGNSLIAIFLPLYILKITGNIAWVFIYYIFMGSVQLLVTYPLARAVSSINPDLSVVISNFFLMAYFLFLKLANTNSTLLLAAAVFYTLMVPFYWLPYHLAFVSLAKRKELGDKVSLMSLFGNIATALAPLIGGVIIMRSGFDLLFNLGLLIIFLSVIPLFFDSYNKREPVSSLNQIFLSLASVNDRANIAGFFGEGMEFVIASIFWPLFMFFVVGNYQTIGLIASISLFLSLIILFGLKKYLDGREKNFFKLGILGGSLNWLVRTFTTSATQIFFVDFSYNLLSLFVWMPYGSIFYKKAKSDKPFDFIIKRELVVHLSKLVTTIIIVFIWWYTQSIFFIFLLAILGLFLAQFLVRE